MAVKIRLRRTGRKKQPSYRLVVADTNSPRDGQYLDSVGTYNPLSKPADLRIDLEKVDRWLAEGAGMSETAASLIKKARRGGDDKITIRGVGPEQKPEVDVVDAPQAAGRAPAAEKPKAGSRGAPRAETPAQPAAEPAQAAAQPAGESARAAEPPQAAAGTAQAGGEADGAETAQPAGEPATAAAETGEPAGEPQQQRAADAAGAAE